MRRGVVKQEDTFICVKPLSRATHLIAGGGQDQAIHVCEQSWQKGQIAAHSRSKRHRFMPRTLRLTHQGNPLPFKPGIRNQI
jgi:hypothetical protein